VGEALSYLIDEMPFGAAIAVLLAINLAMYFGGVTAGLALYRVRLRARIQEPVAVVSRAEVWLSSLTVALNVLVTAAGLALYRGGYLRLTLGSPWRALFDFALFTLAMDFLMYWLHRAAHLRVFWGVHALHHRYENPTAVSLFALHPLEVLGFGALWIVLLMLYDFSRAAVVGYVGLNLAWGLFGHLGIEIFPRGFGRWPLLGWLSTSTFHNQHHAEPGGNFGFYTVIWDRLFGTLHPRYYEAARENATLRRPE
jgi:Delta7-sterol 5-desaturase